eukprot:2649099-Ditylum_brightwellii.AAC.1
MTMAKKYFMLYGTTYAEQHDKVCTYLHWHILQDVQQPVVPNWRQNKLVETPSTCLDQGHTLMYNMKQRANHDIATNCPNIVLLDETKRAALLIDMICSMDMNIVTATTIKHNEYQDLEIAMKKQYKLCKIQT